MSQYDAAIQLLIKAQDQTGPAFSSLQGNLKKTSDSTTLASAVTSLFSGVAVAGLVSQLQKAGQAAIEHEAVMGRLKSTIEANGGSWAKNGEEIEKAIRANRRFGFADKELAESLNILTLESGSYEEALRRQNAAISLSKAAHIDLYVASRLLGKVTDENVTVLKRYGINVEKGASAEELLAKVMERTGKSAEDSTHTMETRTAVIKNDIERTYEWVGAQSQAIQAISAFGPGLGTAFGVATGAITFFRKETLLAGVASTQFTRSLGSLKTAGMGLAGVLGPAGLIVAGTFAGANAFHQFAKAFSAPGSEGEKMVKAFDEFGEKSKQAGGGAGGWLSALGSTYHDAILAGGATNSLTGKLVEFIKGQDAAKAKQDSLTASIKGSAAAFDILTGSQRDTLNAINAPTGASNVRAQPKTAITALAGVFGSEEAIPAALVKQIREISTNTVGLTGAALQKELGDQVFKIVEDSVTGPVVKDLEAQLDNFKNDKNALATAAAEANKSQDQFMADLTDALKRMRDNKKDLAATIKAALQSADLEPAEKKMADLREAAIKKVHDERDAVGEIEPKHDANLRKMLAINVAWGDTIALAKTYGYVLSTTPGAPGRPASWTVDNNGYVLDTPVVDGNYVPRYGERALGGTMWPGNVYTVGEQNRREAVVMGVGSDASRDGMGGGVTLAPGSVVLNYSGAADAPAAARLAADIVDTVTEAIRQQTRRVGRRASPFGAA